MRKKYIGWLVLSVAIAILMNTGRWLRWENGDKRVLSAETDSNLTIEERVVKLEQRVAALEKKSVTSTTAAKASSVPKESYVQLSEGSGFSTDWTGVSGSGFWLDTSLYGTNVEVLWQGKVEAVESATVDGWVRLYDVTNSRAVDYSEVAVAGGSSVSFYSKPLAIWRGQNQYRLEVRSRTGVGMKIVGARLRIVVK